MYEPGPRVLAAGINVNISNSADHREHGVVRTSQRTATQAQLIPLAKQKVDAVAKAALGTRNFKSRIARAIDAFDQKSHCWRVETVGTRG